MTEREQEPGVYNIIYVQGTITSARITEGQAESKEWPQHSYPVKSWVVNRKSKAGSTVRWMSMAANGGQIQENKIQDRCSGMVANIHSILINAWQKASRRGETAAVAAAKPCFGSSAARMRLISIWCVLPLGTSRSVSAVYVQLRLGHWQQKQSSFIDRWGAPAAACSIRQGAAPSIIPYSPTESPKLHACTGVL